MASPMDSACSPAPEQERQETRSKKVAVRFNCFQDIMLLREVLAENPFHTGKKGWDDVVEKVKIYVPGVSSRTVKDRTTRLVSLFKSENAANLRRSGTEEQYEEKEKLLQEIIDLEEEAKQQLASSQQALRQKQVQEKATVAAIRAASLLATKDSPLPVDSEESDVDERASSAQSPCPSPSPSLPPPAKRMRKSSEIASYLDKKNEAANKLKEAELRLRQDELDVRRREVALQERRLEMENERWRMEMAQRTEDRTMIMNLVQLMKKNLT